MTFNVKTVGFASLMDGIDDMIDVVFDEGVVYVVGSNVEYAIFPRIWN